MSNNKISPNNKEIYETKNQPREQLTELGSKELEFAYKVGLNLPFYSEIYTNITNFILTKYPDIDFDKIEKTGDHIDEQLAYLGRGERLLIYNKLSEPFVQEFLKTYIKPKLPVLKDPLNEINSYILILAPDININKINNLVKDTEIKVNTFKLTYGEKWLLYNNLAHVYLKDMIESIAK